ncbi:MAG TPA: MFS transporter [Pirellulaceae bacterium]|nr:MFS transporter [Pirellulaceae bacterium]
MSQAKLAPPAQPLTMTQWLICLIAAIGFAFDIYELLMLPLIARPALLELGGYAPGSKEYLNWVGILFYVPALCGGVFGLLGGYLTDRLGRRRVLTWSILLYAFSAFFAGFATNLWMLLFFRCLVFVGVCVEFVAAVAWLAELFPNPQQREKVLGYTQAFSSVGGLLVAIANGFAVDYGGSFPAIAMPGFLEPMLGSIDPINQHAPWRYTLMSGLIPALPLIIIRPFLPESPVWAKKREAGTLKRPTIAALFAPQLIRTTIVTAIGFACTLGIAFGAIQQMPQIVPGLAEVQEKSKEEGAKAVAAAKAKGEQDEAKLKATGAAAGARYSQKIASEYTKMQEVGGLSGRFVMALVLAGAIAWGWKLRMFQIPGMILTPLVFWYFLRVPNTTFFEIPLDAIYLGTIPVTTMSLGMFFVGFCTVAQLSFWGNYLPHVYPVHLRGTGESFAANIGGRMIGTSAAFVTTQMAGLMPYDLPAMKMSAAAAIVGTTIAVIGFIASFWLPEPRPEAHDE